MRAEIIRKSMQKVVPKRGVQINIENYTKTKAFAEKNQTAMSVIKKYSKQAE